MEVATNIVELGIQDIQHVVYGPLKLSIDVDRNHVMHAIKPQIGLMHRGLEKLLENKTYLQCIPYFDRLNYNASLAQEHSFVLAVEKLLNLAVPLRAQYIRTLLVELNRVLSHCTNISVIAMHFGINIPAIWLSIEKEKILQFFEMIFGSRVNMNYFRPGGVVKDLPSKFLEDIEVFLKNLTFILADVESLLTDNKIWKSKLIGMGALSSETALSLGCSGPVLRATGVPWDLRKAQGYDAYDRLQFDIPVGRYGDAYDRYLVRMEEIYQSMKLIKQCISNMPKKAVGNSCDKCTFSSSKDDIKNSEDSLLRYFNWYSGSYDVKEGEVYSATEAPNGEFGVYLISDGTSKPYRCRIRTPSFVHLQSLESMAKGHNLSDLIVILGSLDIVMSEVDR